MKHGVILAAGLAFAASAAVSDPKYNDDGEMFLPEGYETWVFVGANLGLGYTSEPAVSPEVFHNVYIEPGAYAHFMDTGDFPDPTQFVFEAYSSAAKIADPVLNAGQFNDKLLAVEAAIKDSNRPTYEGSTEIWAYYEFKADDGVPAQTATAFPDSVCWQCHDQHAGYDNVWVQFYPRLKARLEN